jgi:hypothetical protein
MLAIPDRKATASPILGAALMAAMLMSEFVIIDWMM